MPHELLQRRIGRLRNRRSPFGVGMRDHDVDEVAPQALVLRRVALRQCDPGVTFGQREQGAVRDQILFHVREERRDVGNVRERG
mgnify:CR=1 FL=1